MGLKYGFAGEASLRRLYVRINGEQGFSLARVFLSHEEGKGVGFRLRFLNGYLGHLRVNHQQQLEVSFIEFCDWVPTKEQVENLRDGKPFPTKLIMFEGGHIIREVPDSEFFPPAQHHDDESRFREPNGPWNQVVAMCLRAGMQQAS